MKKLITLFQFLCVSFVFLTVYAQPACEPATLTQVEQQGAGNHIAWTIPLTGEKVTISQCGDYKYPFGDAKFSFGAYHRFTPENLSVIDGAVLTQVVFVPTYNIYTQTGSEHSYILQVYQGGVWGEFGERNPGTLVSSHELNNDNLLFFEENTIILETPVEINGIQELWIGFYCRAFDSIQSKQKAPMGRDDGPRKDGYGNIGWLDNQWYTFYEFSYLNDFNTYIKGIVQTTDGATVNLYFNGDKIKSNIEGSSFYHENPTGEEYCYKVEVNCKEGGVSPFSNEICIPGVGVKENRQAARFTLYPNPANKELRITNYELRDGVIEIYDVFGRKLLSHRHITSSSHQKIDISSLSSGVYFVRLLDEKEYSVQKFVKE